MIITPMACLPSSSTGSIESPSSPTTPRETSPRIIHPDGTNEQYTYNSDSEALTDTNADGNTTSYTYNANGDLTVVQDPLHNLTTMTYTATGRVQTNTNATIMRRHTYMTARTTLRRQLTPTTRPRSTPITAKGT